MTKWLIMVFLVKVVECLFNILKWHKKWGNNSGIQLPGPASTEEERPLHNILFASDLGLNLPYTRIFSGRNLLSIKRDQVFEKVNVSRNLVILVKEIAVVANIPLWEHGLIKLALWFDSWIRIIRFTILQTQPCNLSHHQQLDLNYGGETAMDVTRPR